MDERGARPRRTLSGALRDLLLILLVAAAVLWLFTLSETGEPIHDWLRRRSAGSEEDLLVGLAVAAIGFAVFALMRWRQAPREAIARGAAEERYRTLVEHLPAVVYIDAVDDVSTALYVSPRYEKLVGFTPAERVADPGLWVRQLHPDDRDRVMEESRRTNETGDPFVTEYRMITKDGRVVWIGDEAVLVHGERGIAPHWQGVMFDITKRKLAEETLSHRDAILQAVGFAAERFLKTHDWASTLPEVLERLGTASDVSRVYVYANERAEDGTPLMSLRFEWTAAGVEPHLDDPENQRFPYRGTGFEGWEATLSAGGVIQGHAGGFPAPVARDLERERVSSVAVVPIFAGSEWWGFMGLDECRRERVWPRAEIDALKVAADTLGAAIGRERAERRQAETEQRYRTLVETIPAVTYIDRVDEHSTTLYVSPQLETTLGYTTEAWIRDPALWTDNLHPEDRERVLEAAGRHNRIGEPFHIEYRFRAADGRWRWIRDEATIVSDAPGYARLSQGVMFDITERVLAEEQLREAEQRYRAIVEHIPAAIYVDLPDGSMASQYISPQIEQIMGVTPEQYLADPELWLKLMYPEFREEMRRSYVKAIDERRSWRGEYRIRTPDDRDVWVHDETAFVLDERGEPLFLQGVLFDITERKLAEEALQTSERREREAAERLRAVDEMKNTFLAAVSHELRSPLTSILGTAITLEQHDVPDTDRADLLGRLAQNARKLDRLLSDLLDIDRLNRGILRPQHRQTDLGALVRRTVESLDIPGRPILIEVDPVVAPVDAAKVERIVENLLANAVRHTASDARIWVRVWQEDGGALIAVEDDGPGIPLDLRREIFEPFRQGPTASPHSPGTGIGLSLVAMFAELHGGRAWVQAREGGGASFRVFLPGVATAHPDVGPPNDRSAGRPEPGARFDPAGAG